MKLGQVLWGYAVVATVGQCAELESDALSDWQPMYSQKSSPPKTFCSIFSPGEPV